ncbi:MAG: hypothetical protein CL429_00855 [Acidimicrobiaceae bacterium]|nr:hypothetical protein [Acidimicrobiaceae bacterium]
MAFGIYDIEIEQGETFGLDLTLNDESGALRPLVNYVARLVFRTFTSSVSATDSWETGNEITTHDTAPNLRITVPATSTAAYPVGFYDYDLEIELSGIVEKVLRGKVQITGEASR